MVEHVNRHRPIQKKVWLNADEEKYIKRKMTNAGVKNFSTYARKMMLLGAVVKVDLSELVGIKQEINRIGVNINQITKYVNITETISLEELEAIKLELKGITQLLSSKLKEIKGLEKENRDKDKEKIETWL